MLWAVMWTGINHLNCDWQVASNISRGFKCWACNKALVLKSRSTFTTRISGASRLQVNQETSPNCLSAKMAGLCVRYARIWLLILKIPSYRGRYLYEQEVRMNVYWPSSSHFKNSSVLVDLRRSHRYQEYGIYHVLMTDRTPNAGLRNKEVYR